MRRAEASVYRCPNCGLGFALEIETATADEIVDGALVDANGHRFAIRVGIPDLTYPPQLPQSDQEALAYYQREADVYDEYLPLTFNTFGVDETEARNAMIDGLALKPDSKVLEVGCGSGRDSELIAKRLSPAGELYLQDLSPAILRHAVERMKPSAVPTAFAVANAYHLPFADHHFDACYHFGGLNTFGDISRAFAEMTRVTRPGGKVVVGDESMPPWLRETEFGRILMNSNPHYRYSLPLEHLPVEARNVSLRWIIGGVFYVFEFEVGIGAPTADFDFAIPGPRGGTHRTRYHGHLEGVASDVKLLARKARAKSGKSMHDWLNEAVRRAARAELGDDVG
jgi:ubiquinone/menaquinone biosynthesis C-methylase UbiE